MNLFLSINATEELASVTLRLQRVASMRVKAGPTREGRWQRRRIAPQALFGARLRLVYAPYLLNRRFKPVRLLIYVP